MGRLSNIELLRIVAMIMVLFLHCNYLSLGWIDYNDFLKNPITSFSRALFEQLCVISVNVFVFISGWFGIRANLKGLSSLIFQVLFYHVLIILLFFILGLEVPITTVLMGFYFGASYWFVVAYLILYMFSPVLNIFIEHASRKIYLRVLLFFYLFEFLFGWIFSISGAEFHHGYSALSFIGIYLLAQFIIKHTEKIKKQKTKIYFILYICCSCFPIVLFLVTKKMHHALDYSSPFVLISTISFFFIFNRYNFSSRVINYLACSSFSIYLVHQHPLIINYYIDFMNKMYNIIGGLLYIPFLILFALVFGLSCIIIDKVRILLWGKLSGIIFNNNALSNLKD